MGIARLIAVDDALIKTMWSVLAVCRIVLASPLVRGPTTTWTPLAYMLWRSERAVAGLRPVSSSCAANFRLVIPIWAT